MDLHNRKRALLERQNPEDVGIGGGQPIADGAARRAAILRIISQLRVAHHLPGRIRLQLKAGRLSLAAVREGDVAEAIKVLRELLPGIKSVRLNRLAASVLLEYQASIYPYQLVDALFRNVDGSRTEYLLDSLCNLTLSTEGECHE
jgi:hypothetical protein